MKRSTITLLLLLMLATLAACNSSNSSAPASTLEAEPITLPTGDGDSNITIFTINQSSSTASFTLDEELMGRPTTVVGTTSLVAGQIAVDFTDLTSLQLGTIQIDARGLATDNGMRNRAIQGQILDTGDHPFITFTPTLINGLPDAAAIGETITFTVAGDLTIRDITEPASFTITAQATSDSQITGTGTATVTRADYDLTIPNVASVANVDEEVVLTITFSADRTE